MWRSLLALPVLFSALVPAAAAAEELPKPVRSTLLGGVVFILALDNGPGGLEPTSSGSGTVITKDGWIITNYHVAFNVETGRPHRELAIGFTRNPKERPELTCLAAPDSGLYDRDLDIAVIKCDRDLSGNPLSSKMTFTPIPLGDSETVEIGDEIHIIGYPGVGGETITFTSGKVSGFIGEDGNKAGDSWFKTEAALAPGNSGGAAVNSKGELIGIPTQIHWDNGGGGLVSRVNLVRPMKYAKMFVDDALKMKSLSGGSKIELGGVSVAGQMVSADSGKPINGALVLFLKPGVKIKEVNDKNLSARLFTKAFSDEDGTFQTEAPLKRGNSYGVIIFADGYQPIMKDEGVSIGIEGEPTFDLGAVAMKRK